MAELKTKKTDASVRTFLASITDPEKQRDAHYVARLMQKVTGEKPRMWGSSIVGFGQYHYHYASGREGDFFLTGFSPRAQTLTLYIMPGFGRMRPLLKKLGRHQTGRACLHIRRLADVDPVTLEAIVKEGVEGARALDRSREAARATPPPKTRAAKARQPAPPKSRSRRTEPARRRTSRA